MNNALLLDQVIEALLESFVKTGKLDSLGYSSPDELRADIIMFIDNMKNDYKPDVDIVYILNSIISTLELCQELVNASHELVWYESVEKLRSIGLLKYN